MRKFIGIILAALILTPAFAVNVSDIDTMRDVSDQLSADARDLASFCQQVWRLKNVGFVLTVSGSTESVTLSNQQKQGLLSRYQDLKTKIQSDLNLLP